MSVWSCEFPLPAVTTAVKYIAKISKALDKNTTVIFASIVQTKNWAHPKDTTLNFKVHAIFGLSVLRNACSLDLALQSRNQTRSGVICVDHAFMCTVAMCSASAISAAAAAWSACASRTRCKQTMTVVDLSLTLSLSLSLSLFLLCSLLRLYIFHA